jgi:hypothetical protein
LNSVVDFVGQYSSDRNPEFQVVPLDAGARVAPDPIETAWINEVLCPGFFVSCGVRNESPDQPVGTDARWQQISLEKHYPMTAGRFSISVSGFDRETHHLIVATSPTIEVQVVDDREWRAKVMGHAKELSRQSPEAYELVSLFPDMETMRWLLAEQVC